MNKSRKIISPYSLIIIYAAGVCAELLRQSEKYSRKSIYKYTYKIIFVYHNLLKKFSIIVLLYKCPLGLG